MQSLCCGHILEYRRLGMLLVRNLTTFSVSLHWQWSLQLVFQLHLLLHSKRVRRGHHSYVHCHLSVKRSVLAVESISKLLAHLCTDLLAKFAALHLF